MAFARSIIVDTFMEDEIVNRLVIPEKHIVGNPNDVIRDSCEDFAKSLNLAYNLSSSREWRVISFPDRSVIVRPQQEWNKNERNSTPCTDIYYSVFYSVR